MERSAAKLMKKRGLWSIGPIHVRPLRWLFLLPGFLAAPGFVYLFFKNKKKKKKGYFGMTQ